MQVQIEDNLPATNLFIIYSAFKYQVYYQYQIPIAIEFKNIIYSVEQNNQLVY